LAVNRNQSEGGSQSVDDGGRGRYSFGKCFTGMVLCLLGFLSAGVPVCWPYWFQKKTSMVPRRWNRLLLVFFDRRDLAYGWAGVKVREFARVGRPART
jgi:hypothetical protein